MRLQAQEINWINRRREQEKLESYAERLYLKEIEKTLKRHPRVVREYLSALLCHRAFAKLAILAADQGLFAPESIHLVRARHEELIEIMRELENKINRGETRSAG